MLTDREDELMLACGQGYMPPTLARAVEIWAQDKPIPLTLVTELMEFGYDVPRLERQHRQYLLRA
jgi:hypothetical protein